MIFDEAPYTFYRKVRLGGSGSNRVLTHRPRSALDIPKAMKSMKTIIRRMDEVCTAHGFSFAEKFVEIAQTIREDDLSDPDIKLATMKILLAAQEYIEPKKRATTITVNNRPAAELTEAELRELAGIIDQSGSGSGTAGEARSTVVPFRLRAADEPFSDAIEAPRLPAE